MSRAFATLLAGVVTATPVAAQTMADMPGMDHAAMPGMDHMAAMPAMLGPYAMTR